MGPSLRKILAIVVVILGVAALAIGIAFISIGASTESWMKQQMQDEQITLGVPDAEIAAGEVIDTGGEAKRAGDIVRGHRHAIAPTYGALLGGKQYDPTDPKQLTYSQALNLENYLYLASASFGLTNLAIGAGGALMLIGIALIILGAMTAWRPRSTVEA